MPAAAESPYVKMFLDTLHASLRRGVSLDTALAEMEPHFVGPQLAALRSAADQIRALAARIERLGIPPTLHERGRVAWYPGPQDIDVYWPALKRHMRETLNRSEEVITSVDESSTKVVSCLDFPGNLQFSTRGLVVGYVQSGKTANFTAVISKAADAGFRVFLVLSGLTNSLRRQTQERLDDELIALNPKLWMPWTDVDRDLGDFTFSFDAVLSTELRHLAVVKKNGPRLRRLIRKLRAADPRVLAQCPVMVIDDECDQASVNATGSADRLTAINRLLRELLRLLPRVAYVGYTATPYANVLIDPEYEEDLYPRDFIVSLPRPKDYFGAERLFGRDLLDADDVPPDEHGLDMIRTIPESEVSSLRPANREKKDAFALEVTPSLEESIRYYWLATAAKAARGLGNKHSCMLIHTTVYAQTHLNCKPVIESYIRQLARGIDAGDPELMLALREQWDSEMERVPPRSLGRERDDFESLRPHLAGSSALPEVVVENSKSDFRLNFTPPACRYIVIGGNVLARGLTINELVVSYFLRTASQYDTLMQMGRWFGYRHGYEDLPRIWMTDEMSTYFRDMATVEAEIRNDIAVYERERVTPREFAVRIRRHPDLQITAPNKMFRAVDCEVSFGNQHPQTRKFNRRDLDWLQSNWTAGSNLIKRVEGRRQPDNGSSIPFTDVAFTEVVTFLRAYRFHPAHDRIASPRLIDYITRQNELEPGSLANWNIVVIGKDGGPRSAQPLGSLGKVTTVNRSRLAAGFDADIKALMSRRDVVADIPGVQVPASTSWDEVKALRAAHFGEEKRPLLLLYPIDRHSPATGEGKERTALDAIMEVLGVGIVFPRPDREIASGYVRAAIDPTQFEEAEYTEEELPGDEATV